MKLRQLTLLFLTFLFLMSCEQDDKDNSATSLDTSTLTFQKIASFSNGTGSEGYAEISAFDPQTGKLFIVNPNDSELSVWNISNPDTPTIETPITLAGIPNSVAIHNGLLAVALENMSNSQANGTIATYNTDTQNIVNTYTAGALPDMVTFSPNGRYIISANEGEPSDDYLNDPEGSITIVDLNTNQTSQANFAAFNNTTIGNHFRVFGPNATLAKDVEPEYIAVSDDSKYAYVTLQENNGMAKVDLESKQVIAIYGLGAKDHMLVENAIDASNKDDIIGNFQNWPVYGLYQPDAITFTSINGFDYLITANEGDARDYSGYSEEQRVKDLTLDPTAFPNASTLQADENLGRLKTTTSLGDTDGDGDFDKIYCYGGRSFTIWNTEGQLIYDSQDVIGKKTFELNSGLFNNDYDAGQNNPDDRSDDKGAEPESVITLKIQDKTLLFVGLERTGGIMAFDISNPASPVFLKWFYDNTDIGPEGLIAIPASESPNGKNLIVITNEVSNTVAIYEIN